MPLCLTLTYNSQWTIICHQATRTLFRLTSWQSPCCAPSHATAVRRFWLLLPCGTGWTSTARFNNSNRFHFTFQHQLGCQCNIEWCHYNRPISYQDTLTGRFGYHVASLKTKLQSFPSKADYTHDPTNKLRHPPRKINMRALGICLLLALDWLTVELATFPRCTLWESASAFCVSFAVALFVGFNIQLSWSDNSYLFAARPPGQRRRWAMQHSDKKNHCPFKKITWSLQTGEVGSSIFFCRGCPVCLSQATGHHRRGWGVFLFVGHMWTPWKLLGFRQATWKRMLMPYLGKWIATGPPTQYQSQLGLVHFLVGNH